MYNSQDYRKTNFKVGFQNDVRRPMSSYQNSPTKSMGGASDFGVKNNSAATIRSCSSSNQVSPTRFNPQKFTSSVKFSSSIGFAKQSYKTTYNSQAEWIKKRRHWN